MKAYFTILVILFSVFFCNAQDYEWESASFAKTANNYIPLSKIVITADNHKIFAGRFEGSVTYKGITLTTSLDYGVFIAKLNESDSLIWIKQITEANNQTSLLTPINVLRSDNYNNFYLTVDFADSIYINNQLFIANDFTSSYKQSLLLKYDINGNLLSYLELSGSCYKQISDVFIDERKQLYIYGAYLNDNFNTTTNCSCVFDSLTFSTNKKETFLAKYDSLGNLLWVNTFGNDKRLTPDKFNIRNNAIYISGRSSAATNFNFGSFLLNFPNNYTAGGFIAKYDTSGIFQWAKYYGVKGWDSSVSPLDLIILDHNKIIVGGSVLTQSEPPHLYFQNATSLYGLPVSGAEFNYYIICYDSLGNIIWNDLAQCNGQDYIASMASDSKSNLYLTGNYSRKLYFGNDTLPYAYEDLWVGAYDNIGNKLWAKRAGGSSFASGTDIEVDSEDNIYVNGRTTCNPTTVGDSSYTINGPSVFIAKMTPSIVSSTTNIQAVSPNKKLLKIVDILGRETIHKKNTLLFYIYSDGTVEKKVFVE
jgi:hypothetical protein